MGLQRVGHDWASNTDWLTIMKYHKLGGLKQAEMYYFTNIQAGSPKSMCQQSYARSETLGRILTCLFLVAGGGQFFGITWLAVSSVPSSPSHSCLHISFLLCVYSSRFPFCKDTSYIGLEHILITLFLLVKAAKILFPNSIIFWSIGG